MDITIALFTSAILFLFLGMFALPFVIVMGLHDGGRRQRARLRVSGVRADALVKSFRRISQTQHRVLLEARLPGGSVGRELVADGLSDDWLAHHAALGIPVPIVADRSGATIVVDPPDDRPVPTVGQTARRVATVLGGMLAVSALIGTGIAVFQEKRSRDRDESATPDEVRRLRDAWVAKGLEIERMSPRRARNSAADTHVTFAFESGTTCTVTVRAADARPAQGGSAAPDQNGRLSLSCVPATGKDVPRIKAVFKAFRP